MSAGGHETWKSHYLDLCIFYHMPNLGQENIAIQKNNSKFKQWKSNNLKK